MNQRLDFDPQLPALPLAFDSAAIARLFEDHWPEAVDRKRSQARIVKCRLQDTKYQPGKRCVTTYELEVQQPGVPTHTTIGVVEITPAGLAHRLYNDDPKLPWLTPATDPEEMRERFATLLEDQSIEACRITPVRYKPGARCVFRYDIQSPAGERVLFGKLLAEGGEQLMATIAALHAASLGSSAGLAPAMPRILQPLAYWPEIHTLVQPAVAGGVELNTLAFDPAEAREAREDWIGLAGARLAGLHNCTTVPGPVRTIEDDLDELRDYTAPIASADAALAARYEALIAKLAASVSGQREPAPVASHGAFRTDQFMIEAGNLVMIDLDGFCWANRARDLGNFLAYLRWKAIRQPHNADFIEHAGQVFLDGYVTSAPVPDDRWLAFYQAGSLLKIAGRRFRSLSVKEWGLVPQLLDAALTQL